MLSGLRLDVLSNGSPDPASSRINAQSNRTLTLTLTFPPSELSGAGFKPAWLKLLHYDSNILDWQPVSSTLDASNGQLSGVTSEVGEFAFAIMPPPVFLPVILK